MDPGKQIRRALERLINDDLMHATVESACVSIMEDRRVVVDEITFRRADGRLMSVDVGDMTITMPPVGDCEGRSKSFPALILETYVEQDSKQPWVREGWREADVLQDYQQELADAIADHRPRE